jgi:hypothetical protein
MTQVSMLLDSIAYVDTQPVPSTTVELLISEINEKMLIDPAIARKLVEDVAPFARLGIITNVLTLLGK